MFSTQRQIWIHPHTDTQSAFVRGAQHALNAYDTAFPLESIWLVLRHFFFTLMLFLPLRIWHLVFGTDRQKGREDNVEGHSGEGDNRSCFSSPQFRSSQFSVCHWQRCVQQHHESNKMKGHFNIKSLSAFGSVSISVPLQVRTEIVFEFRYFINSSEKLSCVICSHT